MGFPGLRLITRVHHPELESGRGKMRLVTVGVGAQDSPRFAPAGLLVAHRGVRVMLDGGPGAEPPGRLDVWLVTDERAELIGGIRRLARNRGLDVRAADFERGGLRVLCRQVKHTNHPTFGYLIVVSDPPIRAVWAPEFIQFPKWAAGADLMFAEASGWNRPIRFAGGVGGHLDALSVAREARRHRIRRLVFAHIGRPTIRAMDLGERPPFGEFARDRQAFLVRKGPVEFARRR